MVNSLADLRKLKKTANAGLASEIDSNLNRKKGGDPRFWKPTFGKDGKARCTMKFLPAHPDEDQAMVSRQSHYYKGENGVYANISRVTLGENDPCQEFGWKLFNLGGEKNKDRGKRFLATEKFLMNVYIIEDEQAPENNGKVLIWEVPTSVVKMIKTAIEGDEKKDIDPKDVIGFLETHNFICDVHKEKGFPKYTNCGFAGKPTDLFPNGDIEDYKKVIAAQHKLMPFVDPSNIKSYAELKKQLREVVGREYDVIMASDAGSAGDDDSGEDDRTSKAAATADPPSSDSSNDSSSGGGDGDDEDSYYQRLARRKASK